MSSTIPVPVQKMAHEPAVASNEFWRTRCPVSGKLVARFFYTSQVKKKEYAKMDPGQLYAQLFRANKAFAEGIITPEFTMRVHTKKGWSTFNVQNLCRQNHEDEVGRCQMVLENPSDLFRRFFINTEFVYYACVFNQVKFKDVMSWWDSVPQAAKDQAVRVISRVERIQGTPWSMCYIVFGQPRLTTNWASTSGGRLGGDPRWDRQYETDTYVSAGRIYYKRVRYGDGKSQKNLCINAQKSQVAWCDSVSYSSTNKYVNLKSPKGIGVRATVGYHLDNMDTSWILQLFRDVLNMPEEFYMIDPSHVLPSTDETEIYL